MTLMEDFLFGFEPKRGVSKYPPDREYDKEIQALLYSAIKRRNERHARQRPISLLPPDIDRDRVIGVAVSLYRIYHWSKYAFPTSCLKDEWTADVWREACEKTGTNHDPPIQSELFPENSTKLFLETTKRIADAVGVYYDFNASRSSVSRNRNANLASTLLRDRSFVYREPNPDETLHHPYRDRHPAIQKAINITWFRTVMDVGFDFKKHFSPLPVPAIAYILTAIECCIDEWSDGELRETSWEDERFRAVYQSHLDSLNDFRKRSDDVFEQFRYRLCKEAFKHAGVPFAELGRFISYPPGDTAPHWGPKVTHCKWPECPTMVTGDISERYSGFCCNTHTWIAIHHNLITLCPRCAQRACPEGQRFCSAGCADGSGKH
ncbi:hypothetical protein V8E53_006976 [Lactarius tabidus]